MIEIIFFTFKKYFGVSKRNYTEQYTIVYYIIMKSF